MSVHKSDVYHDSCCSYTAAFHTVLVQWLSLPYAAV